jgi:hypothetical protein
VNHGRKFAAYSTLFPGFRSKITVIYIEGCSAEFSLLFFQNVIRLDGGGYPWRVALLLAINSARPVPSSTHS